MSKLRYFEGGQRLSAQLFLLLLFPLVFSVPVAAGQGADAARDKVPKRIVDRLLTGQPQELVVLFDQKSALKHAEATGLPSQDIRVIERKAAGFAETKRRVLAGFTEDEVAVAKEYSHLPVGLLRVQSKQALDRLYADPEVVGVFEDTLERKALAESLPLIAQPQAAVLWNLGSGTAVAVLDTGLDYTRSAFGSCSAPGSPASCKVAYAADFGAGDGALDEDGHGTNVAGTVLGVAPGTKIVALDVFSGETAKGSDILSAINWVIANKATYNIVAINMSLGSGRYTAPIDNGLYNAAVNQAWAAGILAVVAAGNDGYTDALAQPAATTGVIAVGAVYDSALGGMNWGGVSRCQDAATAADKVTCFSNSAYFLTMLAPGSTITAAGITQSGTSQAAPHVAGAVAVLRAAFPGETLEQTVARLKNGVTVTDGKNDIAKPRLSLPQALSVGFGCSYSLSSTGKTLNAASSTESVQVATSAGCTWSAAAGTSSADWITVTSGVSGNGNGSVNYIVAVNSNAASRTGAITIAGISYTVTQAGSAGEASNILLNSGFEDGPVYWSDSTANGAPVITSFLEPEGGNNWYSWLCGYNNCRDHLYQEVLIPADAQSARLRFKYWIDTEESSGSIPYDRMEVRIYSPPDATNYNSWTFSNLDQRAEWGVSPEYDLSGYRGERIRVQFSATTDSSFITNFFVDDVTLLVEGANPDQQPPSVPTALTALPLGPSSIKLQWNASSDNLGVWGYRLYRNGALAAVLGNMTGHVDSGLAAGTSYSYRVAACDAAGNCSFQSGAAPAVTASASADSIPPTVPTGLWGRAESSGTISLGWNPSSDNVGVAGYNLYRNGTLLALLGNVNSSSDTGLAPATRYSYTIAARDQAGNVSAQSPAVFASTDSLFEQGTLVEFSGPSSFQVTGNMVNIQIDRITNNSYWGHSGSLKLQLWALTTPYFGGAATGYVTASIRIADIDGATDTIGANTYFYNMNLNLPHAAPPPAYSKYALFLLEYDPVYCTAPDGFCIIDYINYQENQPPSVPISLSATPVSSSRISLSWSASSDNVGVTTYQVYRQGVLVSILGNVTEYLDGGLSPSASYSYAVAACDAAGNCSQSSVPASALTLHPPDTQAPSVPNGMTATAVSSTSMKLIWDGSTDNVGVTSYMLYSGGGLVQTLGKVTSTLRTVTPQTSYSYTISACDAAGNCSARSAPANITTPASPDAQPPSVPAGFIATAISSSQINLFWSPSTDNVGVAGYRIYGSDGQTLSSTSTGYIHTSLRSSTSYSYSVTACDAAGNCSAPSAQASATTQGAGGRPGDCDGSDTTTISELQSAIEMFLGIRGALSCVDLDSSGRVTTSELQQAINSLLGR